MAGKFIALFAIRFIVSTSFVIALFMALMRPASAQTIVMASTTSTEQSGLFAHLLPAFQRAAGIHIKVVALGTGQAIDVARRGDADLLFVHDRVAEEKFVADGYSKKRYPVMYNDFILLGPRHDPAGLKGRDIAQALAKIAASNALFISRGDRSGTHAAELRFWSLTAAPDAVPYKGKGYRECGCGMGTALNIAAQLNAYVLSDRGTWLSFKNRGGLSILVEGDTRLFNQYGVMAVSKARFAHVKEEQAQRFVDWIISPEGQATIAAYKVGGEQLFFPNADK